MFCKLLSWYLCLFASLVVAARCKARQGFAACKPLGSIGRSFLACLHNSLQEVSAGFAVVLSFPYYDISLQVFFEFLCLALLDSRRWWSWFVWRPTMHGLPRRTSKAEDPNLIWCPVDFPDSAWEMTGERMLGLGRALPAHDGPVHASRGSQKFLLELLEPFIFYVLLFSFLPRACAVPSLPDFSGWPHICGLPFVTFLACRF